MSMDVGELRPLNDLALSRGAVDRATIRRDDAAWLESAWADPASRVLTVHDGQTLVRQAADGTELYLTSPAAAPAGIRYLLGVDPAGVAYFGVGVLDGPRPPVPGGTASGNPDGPPSGAPDAMAAPQWAGLRQVGAQLSARDAGLMTHTVALTNWHKVAGHCPICGAVTEPASAGSSRRCSADGVEQFPRSDPAVIMLVTDADDRALLARNSQWPPRRVSILAGFVEPGESAELAVAREVHEETGLVVGEVTYLGSQPWPMPHSLMLGYRAVAPGRQQIQVDVKEIADANWYSRSELTAVLDSGELLLPPPVSIAHQIISAWYGRELPGTW
jgi:NAD+ diphosphatase